MCIRDSLVGPVIAAQFGYLPGALWILIGSVLAGAVHDLSLIHISRAMSIDTRYQ